MNRIKGFIKRETVLSAAVILAVLSAMVIRPDREYGSYIDYKTIGLLFCLMTVMAGLQSLGVFKKAGERLLGYVKGPGAVSAVLVFLCFFFSMAITNDVALITFVPFAVAVLKMAGMEPLVLPVVVLQTIGANLGSMLTPIGNPQNLYLYSKAGLSAGRFMELMAPYTAVSFVLLGLCLAVVAVRNRMPGTGKDGRGQRPMISGFPGFSQEAAGMGAANMEAAGMEAASMEAAGMKAAGKGIFTGRLVLYLFLFLLSLGCVARILPWQLLLAVVIAGVWIADRSLFLAVDYSLLLTFCAFFIFIGNMGRVPAFCLFLDRILEGREIITCVGASQIISNVPAALLLSGFSGDYNALIVGTNLGGLGTLIASMASLISYKHIARMYPMEKGRYLGWFTAVNLLFLAVLLVLALWVLPC